ncbi:MAG: Crp/Fnr family transcriptional regulator [Yaniella sp.]|uniref:Crp/Fnr family transcriptional regulator n=1 Tax=Yaniella sp. TaxID=2773929 RepID=UPI00264792E4|nr:Crp/Fnr family transcriptional regulator [Yaniella sp.]MDN5731283.1 Crp/Fnr family transcriptional regulator [Yaniella sp.]MDN5815030.1 Crp/Fnr family transcriptional regulator [Yaniella sp.]MDN5818567.1 Crp/Fnr family transcriptional regulator [Yaniella sp.]MDN5889823.1 Crp/Fnr family transcriptional regulator [Yaniella sp.]MDN5912360.1 Crp/Fnr family transcriptional regulator [Yaniella sp.]
MRELLIRDITEHDDNCVRRVPIFSGLTTEQQDLVATVARPQILSAGELVHGAGERTGKMFVVHTGEIKISRTLPSGRKQLLRVARPGETLGEHAFLTGNSTLEEAEARSQTRLCVFVHDDLTKLIDQYPNIAHRMLRTLGDRLAHTEHRLTLSSQSVDVRIADYLLQQPLIRSGQVTNGIMRVQLPLSKKDIASLLGTTPESLSRALSRLRNKGFLTVDDDIVSLLQPDELEHLITGD